MSNGADKYSPDDRIAAFVKVQDVTQGREDVVSVYDQFPTLELSPLREEIMQKAAENLSVRTELQFKMALYRSLRYAVASSQHCLRLGKKGNLRELYEGARLLYPSEKDPLE